MSTWLLAGMAGAVVVPYLLWQWHDRRRNRRGAKLHADIAPIADELVPVSLHPVIDADACIGSGACIRACPEKEVLAMVGGQARLVNPLACVGHGACMRACPVSAIKLVFGTATRGVELPMVSPTFETTQPGLYIAGELGGMGLIRNAIEQARQAADAIVSSSRRGTDGGLDAVVVGAGPAGIAAAAGLIGKGLRVQIVEQGLYGGTIQHYPRAKVVMSGHLDIPSYGQVKRRTMTKEQLLELWDDIRARLALPVKEGVKVEKIERRDERTWRVSADGVHFDAANVVLALGRRGAPRQLEVPGEELPKVHYRLIEPDPFRDKHVLIVGGGNAAADAAIALAEARWCKSVGLSYRRGELMRMRASVRDRLQALVAEQAVTLHLNTQVVAIEADTVELKRGSERLRLPNDAVVVQIGGTSPNELLKSAGITLVEKFGQA